MAFGPVSFGKLKNARLVLLLCFTFNFSNAMPSIAKDSIPRLILIGDSTVKCGGGKGGGGMWGWGSFLGRHFDPDRIQLQNLARGGRSSRTYLTEGLWDKALAQLRPGDFLLMQFGHNDGGKMFEGDRPRASIKGNGDETKDGIVVITGERETVYSYGWYLRKYISDAKTIGATPIVLSLVPRNRWEGELGARSVIRSNQDYGLWAKEAARDAGVHFIDLNEIVASRYEQLGEEKVGRELFTENDWTHTIEQGAKVNAACVVEGILGLSECDLKDFLKNESPASNTNQSTRRFDFGSDAVAEDYKQVLPTTFYNEDRCFGLHQGSQVENVKFNTSHPLTQDALQSNDPFFFSVDLPEGNYRVKLIGGPKPLTVKAELRRLMFHSDNTTSEGILKSEFTVNIRSPVIDTNQLVRLKPREQKDGAWAWDNRLTLEFNGPKPCVSSIVIEPESEAITVFLAGDSTVTDQPYAPWNSWGQMLTQFFKPGVAIANHAESGESIRSSLGAGRFEKIFSLMKSGDYLLIQFGHNDMKDKTPNALAVYRNNMIEIINRAQALGGMPVLITSMERKSGIHQSTLGDYPQTVREIAQELDIPLIDLHKMSRKLYKQLGNNLSLAFQDGTHHNNYGSFLLAKCVIQGIADNQLSLAAHIDDNFMGIDLANPDPIEKVTFPVSPRVSLAAPDGS